MNSMSEQIFQELVRSAGTVPVEISVSHLLHESSLTASLKNRLFEHMRHYSATCNEMIEIARIHKGSYIRQKLHQLTLFVLVSTTHTEKYKVDQVSSSVSFYLNKTRKALASTIIQRALESFSEDERPFFQSFVHQKFEDKTVKFIVQKFLYICMLMAKKHQNLIVFNIYRNIDFGRLKRSDFKKFEILETYAKLQKRQGKITHKILKTFLQELKDSDNAEKLVLFMSKRLWQIVSMSDRYVVTVEELY